jgi:hypothetical protein
MEVFPSCEVECTLLFVLMFLVNIQAQNLLRSRVELITDRKDKMSHSKYWFTLRTHAVKGLYSLLAEVDCCSCPMGIAMIHRDEHHIFRKQVKLCSTLLVDGFQRS